MEEGYLTNWNRRNCPLFPSLSAVITANAVRTQIKKSEIIWNNIDNRWLTLYLKLNENNLEKSDLDSIKLMLPKRISKMGGAPSFGSYNVENKVVWPQLTEHIPPN